jgi:hypothetical protein
MRCQVIMRFKVHGARVVSAKCDFDTDQRLVNTPLNPLSRGEVLPALNL